MSQLPRLVSAVGGLLIVIALAQALFTVRVGGPILKIVFDFLFFGLPGFALVVTGFWMPGSDIHRRYYPRMIAWLLGGVVVMYGFIVLRDLHPGVTVEWSLGTQAIALTIGSIGGLLIGVQETQATMRREQLEKRTRELTEREALLEQQNERLEKFAGIVSHDLRNPLNVATNRLELAREDCASDHLDHVASAHDRMDTLIDDLLTIARQGEQVESSEPVDLTRLAEGCWQNVATSDARLDMESDVSVMADPDRLPQLFENLFRNSVEHGSPSSRTQSDDAVEDGGEDVSVTVGRLSDGQGFYIADDGPGIPDDEQDQVFEHGYSTDQNGTGFGLAIVRVIAEAHGWKIAVTDGADGGARFEISGVTFAQ